MAGEIIGDVIGAILEVALGAATESKKYGCLIMLVILLLIGGLIYFVVDYKEKHPIKGIIMNKLSNDRVLLKTKNGDDVFVITRELYRNKEVGDSISITD